MVNVLEDNSDLKTPGERWPMNFLMSAAELYALGDRGHRFTISRLIFSFIGVTFLGRSGYCAQSSAFPLSGIVGVAYAQRLTGPSMSLYDEQGSLQAHEASIAARQSA